LIQRLYFNAFLASPDCLVLSMIKASETQKV